MKPKRIVPFILILIFLCACSVFFFPLLTGRSLSQPEETRQKLFEGITYTRKVKQSPRDMVIHILDVHLKEEGIKTIVTSATDKDSDKPLKARTTSQFLQSFGVQVAVNGDGFTPWYSIGPFYYPHSGNFVTPNGFAASNGIIYTEPELYKEVPTLFLTKDGRATINYLNTTIYNAVSGPDTLIFNGNVSENLGSYSAIHPRTAVGVNEIGTRLYIVVVDGRQPGYSMGATLNDLVDIMQSLEAYSAINLDGGGSSTMVVQGEDGQPVVLNSPIHQRIPGRERPIGNHIGIFANEN